MPPPVRGRLDGSCGCPAGDSGTLVAVVLATRIVVADSTVVEVVRWLVPGIDVVVVEVELVVVDDGLVVVELEVVVVGIVVVVVDEVDVVVVELVVDVVDVVVVVEVVDGDVVLEVVEDVSGVVVEVVDVVVDVDEVVDDEVVEVVDDDDVVGAVVEVVDDDDVVGAVVDVEVVVVDPPPQPRMFTPLSLLTESAQKLPVRSVESPSAMWPFSVKKCPLMFVSLEKLIVLLFTSTPFPATYTGTLQSGPKVVPLLTMNVCSICNTTPGAVVMSTF
jgi:hypothetical protein